MAAFNCLHEKNKKGKLNQRSDTAFSHRGTPAPSPSEKKVDEKYSPKSNSLKKCFFLFCFFFFFFSFEENVSGNLKKSIS